MGPDWIAHRILVPTEHAGKRLTGEDVRRHVDRARRTRVGPRRLIQAEERGEVSGGQADAGSGGDAFGEELPPG